MNKITAISLTTLALSAFYIFPIPSKASSVILETKPIAAEKRDRSEAVKDEYYRGFKDGVNRAEYDNPRHSLAYYRGYQDGLHRRRG